MSNMANTQPYWTLDSCFQYLMAHHLRLKSQDMVIQEARLDQSIAKQSMHPQVMFFTNGGWQLGRTIDPTTNAFHNQSIGYVSSGLNVQYSIFNGGHNQATLELQKAQLNRQEASYYHQSWALKRELLVLFFEVLKAKELVHLAALQVQHQQFQYDYLELLINQGVKPINERIPFQTAQLEKKAGLNSSRNPIRNGHASAKKTITNSF